VIKLIRDVSIEREDSMKYRKILLFLAAAGLLLLYVSQALLAATPEATVKLTVPNLPAPGGG